MKSTRMDPRALAMAIVIGVTPLYAAENRDTKVRNDKSQVEETGLWIYNDLNAGITKAERSGKPLLVTLRCIP